MSLLGRIPLKPLSFIYDKNIEGDREAKIAEILQRATVNELVIDRISGEIFLAVMSESQELELVSMTEKLAHYLLGEEGGFSGDDILISVQGYPEPVKIGDVINELNTKIEDGIGKIDSFEGNDIIYYSE